MSEVGETSEIGKTGETGGLERGGIVRFNCGEKCETLGAGQSLKFKVSSLRNEFR